MKAKIRIEIEKILRSSFGLVYIDATNKAKSKYRMKLVTGSRVTKRETEKILSLPHVLSVGYYLGRTRLSHTGRTYHSNFPGIVVYFDCKPSEIILNKN